MAGNSGKNKKKNSATQKANYKAYEVEMRWKKNRVKRLKKHLEKFPNDKGAEKALKELSGQMKPRSTVRPKGGVVDRREQYPNNLYAAHLEIRNLRSELSKYKKALGSIIQGLRASKERKQSELRRTSNKVFRIKNLTT